MEEGTFKAKVVQHYLSSSAQKGTPCVIVTFELDGDEHIAASIWLTDAAMGMARKNLKAIGFDVDKLNVSELGKNPVLLAGNEAELVIGVDDYAAKYDRGAYKVKYINALGAKPKQMDLDRITKALRAAKNAEQEAPAESEDPAEEDMSKLDPRG